MTQKEAAPPEGALTLQTLSKDPVEQFAAWFEDARAGSGQELPEAMCLSTADAKGRPEGRMVLLKRFGPDGFVFFTNFKSAKSRSLAKNPWAALTFHWEKLGRQVRVQGKVVPVSNEEADAYFQTRPREYQLGAWASTQSAVLGDRDELTEAYEAARARFEGKPVARPPYWSGYRLEPRAIEFWQSRPSRLHDRFLFTKAPTGRWKIERLAP